jgi:hypothetical protein
MSLEGLVGLVALSGALAAPGRAGRQPALVRGRWCEGTFSGLVEFRDWRPRARKYVIHRIGTFSVRVRVVQLMRRPSER